LMLAAACETEPEVSGVKVSLCVIDVGFRHLVED